MIILGLHFGHDASVSVIVDGLLVTHVLRERHCRVKHALGLTADEVSKTLDAAGVSIRDVDYCALVSTQDMEILTGLFDGLSIELKELPGHQVPSPFKALLARSGLDPEAILTRGLERVFRSDEEIARQMVDGMWRKVFSEWRDFEAGRIASLGWMNMYTTHDLWHQGRTFEDLKAAPLPDATFSDEVRLGMHFPVAVTLFGRTLPGYFIDHHVCHAASVYYRSGFDHAAVISNDGGDGTRNLSGYFLLGRDEKLWVLSPHNLSVGGLYLHMGHALGFPIVGAEGKLMGLASYGEPRFYDEAFSGNCFDVRKRTGAGLFDGWKRHCLTMAQKLGYTMEYGTRESVLSPLSVDLAASTQRLFEASSLAAAETLHRMLEKAAVSTPNLCLTGGCALNCPGNSTLLNEGPFSSLFVEPNCDDGGLSVGGALYIYHNMLGYGRDAATVRRNQSPYRGLPVGKESVESVLSDARGRYSVASPGDLAGTAARDLYQDRLVGWFEGRSEMGPRALCHRSLLADARHRDNWRRVNEVKHREPWRPLAPVVLESESTRWFQGCPARSPYMLFTATVKSDQIPAVTHVDNTARIQTVDMRTGEIHRVLQEYQTLSGVPVLMNTSLNGPGEPIVETPGEAYAFFERSGLDVLYLEGWRIARESGEAAL